jgi:hypothetical protein
MTVNADQDEDDIVGTGYPDVLAGTGLGVNLCLAATRHGDGLHTGTNRLTHTLPKPDVQSRSAAKE